MTLICRYKLRFFSLDFNTFHFFYLRKKNEHNVEFRVAKRSFRCNQTVYDENLDENSYSSLSCQCAVSIFSSFSSEWQRKISFFSVFSFVAIRRRNMKRQALNSKFFQFGKKYVQQQQRKKNKISQCNELMSYFMKRSCLKNTECECDERVGVRK